MISVCNVNSLVLEDQRESAEIQGAREQAQGIIAGTIRPPKVKAKAKSKAKAGDGAPAEAEEEEEDSLIGAPPAPAAKQEQA